MKKAVSSYANKTSIDKKIIIAVLTICVCFLMSGLIVLNQIMESQVKFYQAALAYCYENDCQELANNAKAELNEQ